MRWRYLVIMALIVVPVLAVLIAGGRALWQTGRLEWLLWLLPICWGAAYLLARLSKRRIVADASFDSPRYWTDRDDSAWTLVEAKQRTVKEIDPEQLAQPRFYLDTALDLATEIARHYHPKSKDPIGSVTIVEILAVAELAVEESAQWVEQYVPGSHLLTVDHWRTLSKAPRWIRTVGDLTWLSSLLLNPSGAVRYVTSKLAGSSATRQLQNNVLASFFVAFVRFAGFYLIEMNSGRMRGGAERYRELRAKLRSAAGTDKPVDPDDDRDSNEVTIALVGQTNAGKSSLVNSLLGENSAAVDVLPKTQTTERYRFELPKSADQLVLLDTPGYDESGATGGQTQDIHEALSKSDLVLLVMDVTNSARKPDAQIVSTMKGWTAEQPEMKLPPLLGVLTHIDQLPPALEWSPPYNWQRPTTSKERTIAEAVAYNGLTLGELCQGVIPVCTDVANGRVYGIEPWLLPAMIALLEEARACSLIRALQTDVSRSQVKRTFGQLYKAGVAVLKASVSDASPSSRRSG